MRGTRSQGVAWIAQGGPEEIRPLRRARRHTMTIDRALTLGAHSAIIVFVIVYLILHL